MGPAPPQVIGCVACGAEAAPEDAIWAQCEVCGKTCGYCKGCAADVFFRRARYTHEATLRIAQRFVYESMDWHLTEVHDCPPAWQRIRLRQGPVVELF